MRRTTEGILDAVWRAVREHPLGWLGAAEVLSGKLRAARHLHSHERRVVADALHQIVRGQRRLQVLAGQPHPQPHVLYLAWVADEWLQRDASGELPPALHFALRGARIAPEGLAARYRAAAGIGAQDDPRRLGEALSYPDWLVSRLQEELGHEAAFGVLQAQNGRAPLSVRANLLKCTRQALAERLATEGIASTPSALSPVGLILHTRVNVYGLPAFADGWMEVQDEGSQLIAELVAPPPGSMVVDACAGAGGKTLALAALMGNKGRILAVDPDRRKLQELHKRARRSGLTSMQAVAAEAARLPPGALTRGAARVLVDAPCSGLGVLRRNPEARWRIGPSDVAELSARQRAILAACAAHVAPQGRLIYATCTLLRQENDAVIEDFLARHPAFSEVPVKEVLGRERALLAGDGQRLRTLPRTGGPDGFFAAVLRRHEGT